MSERPRTVDRLIELDHIVTKYIAVTERFNERPDVAGAYTHAVEKAKDTQQWLRERIIRVTQEDAV